MVLVRQHVKSVRLSASIGSETGLVQITKVSAKVPSGHEKPMPISVGDHGDDCPFTSGQICMYQL